jgi:uncharacterized protein
MSVAYGISVNQVPTSLIPPVKVDGSLPFAVGCAPIHRVADPVERAKVMPGNIVLCYSDAESGQKLGIMATRDDFEKWGLSEVAFSSFMLYGKAPVIFANVFDPTKHFKPKNDEVVTFLSGSATLSFGDVLNTITLKDAENTAYTEGVDYTINKVTGVITVIEESALELAINAGKIFTASYRYAAPELVTPDDIIGGYDVLTGITSGLELVEQAFPKYRMVPGILLAPNFSQDTTVAMIMAAKCEGINAVFNCVAYADLPTDASLKQYTDVPGYKAKVGLTDKNLFLCWPKVKFGTRTMNLSTHAAGATAAEDRVRNDIPYSNPSNNTIRCDAVVTADGTEVSLSIPQANSLRGQGIATVLNFTLGNTLWGAYTAAYPGNTDSKDSFISSRRMLAWYGNQLILTWWQKVDDPNNNRLIQTIANSEQMNLNALVAVGALAPGSSIAARPEDNSVLSLMTGTLSFHVMLGLIMPAQTIKFDLEFDPYLLQNIF